MFLSGIKFGMGFCLGACVLTALVLASICLSSWISRWLERWRGVPRRQAHTPKGMEWKRRSASVIHDDGSLQSFSFSSVIRWEDREGLTKSHYRDGVR